VTSVVTGSPGSPGLGSWANGAIQKAFVPPTRLTGGLGSITSEAHVAGAFRTNELAGSGLRVENWAV
jgi:hypothetical protein